MQCFGLKGTSFQSHVVGWNVILRARFTIPLGFVLTNLCNSFTENHMGLPPIFKIIFQQELIKLEFPS